MAERMAMAVDVVKNAATKANINPAQNGETMAAVLTAASQLVLGENIQAAASEISASIEKADLTGSVNELSKSFQSAVGDLAEAVKKSG
jgi:hypothetical protein